MNASIVLTSVVAPVVIALASGGVFVSLLQRKKVRADTATTIVDMAIKQAQSAQSEFDRARARAEEAEGAQEIAEDRALELLQQLRRLRIAALAAGVELPADNQKGL